MQLNIWKWKIRKKEKKKRKRFYLIHMLVVLEANARMIKYGQKQNETELQNLLETANLQVINNLTMPSFENVTFILM